MQCSKVTRHFVGGDLRSRVYRAIYEGAPSTIEGRPSDCDLIRNPRDVIEALLHFSPIDLE